MMKTYESIRAAVNAAVEGDTEAFGYLYEISYTEKYRIALRYMRNTSDAEDVLEDAYVVAWKKLDTLKDPDRFSAWCGQIVAHTAINALNKKKPLLFAADENDEDITFDLPDEHTDTQPELSYTEKERTQIIESMLDALSEEQRVCVIMFYMEEMKLAEIADVLGCPVSTVKSRLKYAKDNLHRQAEVLQKKGYSFYGLAPLPFFLYLLDLESGTVAGIVGGAVAGSAPGIVGGTVAESAAGTAAGVSTGGALTAVKLAALIGGIVGTVGITVGIIFIAGSDPAPVTPSAEPIAIMASEIPVATSTPEDDEKTEEVSGQTMLIT